MAASALLLGQRFKSSEISVFAPTDSSFYSPFSIVLPETIVISVCFGLTVVSMLFSIAHVLPRVDPNAAIRAVITNVILYIPVIVVAWLVIPPQLFPFCTALLVLMMIDVRDDFKVSLVKTE